MKVEPKPCKAMYPLSAENKLNARKNIQEAQKRTEKRFLSTNVPNKK
jgi:hypothetical protein